jgi:hypothetical protein
MWGAQTQKSPADETSSAGVHPWMLASMLSVKTLERLAAKQPRRNS